jgi:hypothetical protein
VLAGEAWTNMFTQDCSSQTTHGLTSNYLGNGRSNNYKTVCQFDLDYLSYSYLALGRLNEGAAAGGPWSTIRPEPRHRVRAVYGCVTRRPAGDQPPQHQHHHLTGHGRLDSRARARQRLITSGNDALMYMISSLPHYARIGPSLSDLT